MLTPTLLGLTTAGTYVIRTEYGADEMEPVTTQEVIDDRKDA